MPSGKIVTKPGILIVDDNQPMRELLKITLAGVAEIVGECAEGAESLAAYDRLRPDLVLMDVGMKNVDGITATRRIIEAFPQKARIAIVTDYYEAELRREAFEAGACIMSARKTCFIYWKFCPKNKRQPLNLRLD